MNRSIVIFGAHPDDETFFAGGTIAKYADEGAHVTIVCGTRGERGATGNLCTVDELPARREQELRDAAKILGADVIFLDYEDQKLSAAPPNDIRLQLVKTIRETRPQVAITFDPNGANLHTDHIGISRFASDALAAAADPRWYADAGPPHSTPRLLWQSHIVVFELASTANLPECPGTDFIIDVNRWWRTKEAALRAHRTQVPGFGRLFFGKPNTEQILSIEAFRLGAGPPPSVRPSFDLFDGLA